MKFFQNLNNIRTIIYAILIIVLIIAFLIGIRFAIRKLRPDDLLNKTDVKKSNLTYDDSVYAQIASSLYRAMEGMGTQESVVYSNLAKLKNKDDYYQLIKTFGRKENMNLIEWLVEELDSSEIAQVNSILEKFGESI